MNVSNKTTRTYTVSDITEQQARDLLSVARIHEDQYTDSEEETLNNLRQALLNAGVKLTEGADHASSL